MAQPELSPESGDALRFIRMSGIFYGLSELTEPWGLELPPMDSCVWFHAVTFGECAIDVDGACRTLTAGDFVLVPHSGGHRAWGRSRSPTVPVFDLNNDYVNDQYAMLRYGGGGALTTIVCGCIRFGDHPAVRRLFSALPPLIQIDRTQTAGSGWLQPTLRMLAEETRTVRPGSDAVISRLCDIVVMQSIRSWIEGTEAAQTGWLKALRDPRIGRVIAQIHANPAQAWGVSSLAAEAGLSRSAFSARFTNLVGEPAMRYVTVCRMHHAAHLLQDAQTSVAQVAATLGYESEAAFSRAFKRVTGETPRGSARRQSGLSPTGMRIE